MLESFNVKDKVIIITGATGMLGSVCAREFSLERAKVVLVDLDQELCENRAEELADRYGAKALGIQCDVTNKKNIEEMVEEVVSKYHQINVLMNNAAIQTDNFFAPFEEYSIDDWQKVMSVNVTGMFLCSQRVAEEMKRTGSGSIINIASIYGVVAPDHRIYEGALYKGRHINTPLVYSTSKGAVISLTRYLAVYLARYNIRVNSVTPGGIYSGQDDTFFKKYSARCPLGRMAEPEEIFHSVQFLASDASSYITGHNLIVDGGWTVW
jgi:NAD(P)-dependent dehydrogenase (short-subunit alcohol dehydrogenase family)